MLRVYIFLIFMLNLSGLLWARQADSLVLRKNFQFIRNGKPYYFMGTNYWYGGVACITPEGRKRVAEELDFLLSNGVMNVRVLAAGEGVGPINGMLRVTPAYQPTQGVFDEQVLKGLDYLMVMLRQRGMTAVLYLSNNWDWSGGFLQYLNWNGLLPDTALTRKLSWDENRDVVSKFYDCNSCIAAYHAQIQQIVRRTNTLSGIPYAKDVALMSWELANEPRPMRPAAIASYIQWIDQTATLIKQLDPNHLVTTGCEGESGTETLNVFKQIHQLPGIDYSTIHIWPKNWGWFSDTTIGASLPQIIANSNNYIKKHLAIATQIKKPLVIEEFGLPRNGHRFDTNASVSMRDQYYASVFAFVQQSAANKQALAGCNFWAFSGSGRATQNHLFWAPGDALLGDPPQEEQGLNSVFDSDASTWTLIRKTAGTLQQHP